MEMAQAGAYRHSGNQGNEARDCHDHKKANSGDGLENSKAKLHGSHALDPIRRAVAHGLVLGLAAAWHDMGAVHIIWHLLVALSYLHMCREWNAGAAHEKQDEINDGRDRTRNTYSGWRLIAT